MLSFPKLSEADPVSSSEGTLDPLGLYPIADSLANKLAPGVRERQRRPRFLTSIVLGTVLCSDFDSDIISIDGISPPWQILEWCIVEGLVRKGDGNDSTGVPGKLKTQKVIQTGNLTAQSYLKNPLTFGFNGVYRILGRTLGVVKEQTLGPWGERLLACWEKEQGYTGFLSGQGKGWEIRQKLRDAVAAGLKNGTVNKGRDWEGWTFVASHLAPGQAGKEEANVILDTLMQDDKDGATTDFRRQLISFLKSDDGCSLMTSAQTFSEKTVHQSFSNQASPGLTQLLTAIARYETFSRLLQDAFDSSLFVMSETPGKVSLTDLLIEPVKTAAETIPHLFDEVAEALAPFGEDMRFRQMFTSLGEKMSPLDWLQSLFEHHKRIQANKPPEPKNPWFHYLDGGQVMIRPQYRRMERPAMNGEYVHFYRTAPLWSFLRDLGVVAP